MKLFVLMKPCDWCDLSIPHTDKFGIKIQLTGMKMPIGGVDEGFVPVTGYLPVFSTYEHAEAARNGQEIPILEIKSLEEDNEYPNAV